MEVKAFGVCSFPFSESLPKLPKMGGFNPLEKYARQNGNLPQIGAHLADGT